MNRKFLLYVPLIFLLLPGCSNNNRSKQFDQKNAESTKNVDSSMTKAVSPPVYSLEQDKQDEKKLLREYHDEYSTDVNLDQISQMLSSGNPNERQQAVKLLSYFPEYGTLIPEVEKLLLEDGYAEVRSQCAITLQLLESKKSIAVLIKALEDSDIDVRANSMEALAALGEKENSFRIAEELWDHGKEDAHFRACHFAFRDIATPQAVEMLKYDMNNNADKNIAASAAIILAQLGYSDETLPFLEQLLEQDDEYIRMAAIRGLSYIGNDKALQLINSKSGDPSQLVQERVMAINEKFKMVGDQH